MKKLIRLTVLIIMLSAAAGFARGAYKTLENRSASLPEGVYAQLLSDGKDAECYLGGSGGCIAVFADKGRRKMLRATDIELSALREGDRAMLGRGIPVRDEKALLQLLEDLGS